LVLNKLCPFPSKLAAAEKTFTLFSWSIDMTPAMYGEKVMSFTTSASGQPAIEIGLLEPTSRPIELVHGCISQVCVALSTIVSTGRDDDRILIP
jgi:hypothetical protein